MAVVNLRNSAVFACDGRIRIGLVADFLEERWFSMDFVADMLRDYLSPYDDLSVSLLRPEMRKLFTRFGTLPGAGLAWNADRVCNRFWGYPAWLKPRAVDFDLFHIVDHSYAKLALHLPAGRTVVTCHDVDAFRCLVEPSAGPKPRGPAALAIRSMTRRILTGLRSAARVLCDSRTVQTQLVSLGLVPGARTEVVYNGTHPACRPHACEGADRAAAALLCGNASALDLLHVGSTIPRKRIDVLLRIVAALIRTGLNVRLIRAGGDFTQDQNRLVAELGIGRHVLVLPYLDREVLAAVYRKAVLVMQPSEAEGFGLPVIEAMACGTPVVASDLAVFREVGGEAVTYCPVADIEAWADAVRRLLGERELSDAKWSERRAAALERASQFSLEANARHVRNVYKKILNGNRHTNHGA